MIEPQVVSGRISAIARELAETLGRTARSSGLAEGKRYAAAVLTGKGGVAAQVQFDASQFHPLRSSVAALLDYFAFDLDEGDIVAVGDPYAGGSTSQVITFAAPYFHQGEIVLFPVVRAELADLAGEFPGRLHPLAKEIWQESIRVTPVKLFRHGVLQQDILRILVTNSRASTLVRADIEAIVSALRASIRNLARLLGETPRRLVEESVKASVSHSRRFAETTLSALEGLDKRVEATLQPVEGEAVVIHLRVTVNGGRLKADFTGTGAQTKGPYNITPQHVRSYVLAAALAEALDEIPVNDGALDAVDVVAPAGSLVNPSYPAATNLSDLVTAHTIASLVRSALYGDRAPRVDGPSPAIVVFAPIGSSDYTPPFVVEPGFSPSGQGFASAAIAGQHLLPSAEITEAREGFQIISREFHDDGSVHASVRNKRGPLQAVAYVPEGSLSITSAHARRSLRVAAALPVEPEAVFEFVYPHYAGDYHVKS